MTEAFKVGDHVRLKPGHRHAGLVPGDTGTVVAVAPAPDASSQPSYHVRLNRTTAGLFGTFVAEELELLK
jgi:hypothetical protein